MEDRREGTTGQGERFRFERVVVKLIEVAFVGEFLLRPDALEAFDELTAAPVALRVVGGLYNAYADLEEFSCGSNGAGRYSSPLRLLNLGKSPGYTYVLTYS